MTHLDSVLKSRDYHFVNKGPYSKSCDLYSSHVWMWELDHKEAWAAKIDAFQLWCWRRFLRVPWRTRRSNQSILKKINPEYSLEGLMLKLQYFGHLMQRADSLEKTLMLGKIEGKRRRGDRAWEGRMASVTQWTWVLSKLQEIVKDREAWHAVVHRVAKSWTWLSDWTTTSHWDSVSVFQAIVSLLLILDNLYCSIFKFTNSSFCHLLLSSCSDFFFSF